MVNPRISSGTIQASYRIVTPMFSGGAEQRAEFRLPSFKGVLRFWWRALAWSRLQNEAKLRQEEAELFGSSDEGQSRFLMRLTRPPAEVAIDKRTQLADCGRTVGEGARYLGYGVMEAYASQRKQRKEAELIRECLAAPDSFGLSLYFRRASTSGKQEQQQQIGAALKLVGLLGGMGSKSRKGYGSLTLTNLAENESAPWTVPKSFDMFRTTLRSLVPIPGNQTLDPALSKPETTPLTAFAEGFRIVAIEGRTGETALHLLDRIGREMVRFRSWGSNGKVLRAIDTEKLFQPDHDLMKLNRTQRTSHPVRIAFGLPHNYGKADRYLDVTAEDKEIDRRASPLFIHIHQPEGSLPIGVLTFLPAMFLPQGRDRIAVGGTIVPLQTADLWKPVTDFLDRLLDASSRKEFSESDRIEEVTRG